MRGRAIRRGVVAVAVGAIPIALPTVASGEPARIAYASDRGNQGDIYTLTLDGSAPRRLTTTNERETEPAFSPDGRTIAYTRERELWLMDSDGGNQRVLSGQYTHRPTWSPDGRRIAFWGTRGEGGGNGIYSIGADGADLRRITSLDDSRSASMPSYSPDGSTLVFQRDTYLTLIGSDGLGDRPLSLDFHGTIPAWSPVGDRIAFSIQVAGGATEIHTVRPDGTGLTRLTHIASNELAPSWSPDGSRIAFGSDRDGNQELYVMDSDGGGVTRLTHDPNGYGPTDGAPSWDPSSGSGPRSTGGPLGERQGTKARLVVERERRQRLRKRGVAIAVGSARGTRVAVRGRLRLPGGGHVALRSVRHVATSRKAVVLELRLRPRARARAKAALLRHRRPAVASIRVSALDAAGRRHRIDTRVVVLRPR